MQLANDQAIRLNHEYVGTEHILLGLVQEGSGVAANVLKDLGIDEHKILREVEKIIVPGPHAVTMTRVPQTPRAKRVVEYAVAEAQARGHEHVGTEDLLLGLLTEHEGVGAQVLFNLGLNLATVRAAVYHALGLPLQASCMPRPAPGYRAIARLEVLINIYQDLYDAAATDPEWAAALAADKTTLVEMKERLLRRQLPKQSDKTDGNQS
jgi:ATP-dependent Clp protease ATP-binding subunit ClpA